MVAVNPMIKRVIINLYIILACKEKNGMIAARWLVFDYRDSYSTMININTNFFYREMKAALLFQSLFICAGQFQSELFLKVFEVF